MMNSNEVREILLQYKEAYGQIPDWAETIGELMPELLNPWLQIRAKAIEDGVLSRKIKELILLAINLVRRYPSGIDAHVRGALDSGASPEEIMETIAVAIVSSAAPAIYNGPRALKGEMEKRKHKNSNSKII